LKLSSQINIGGFWNQQIDIVSILNEKVISADWGQITLHNNV